jgi:phosphate transport system permease protein
VDANLARVIARRKRQDFLFNLLGIACTLVGIVTLAVLLADLLIDGLGLLGQYRKEVAQAKDAKVSVEKKVRPDGQATYQMTLVIPAGTFVADVSASDAEVIRSSEPSGPIMLEGDRLRVLFGEAGGDVIQERIDVRLNREQVQELTRDDSKLKKAVQVGWRFITSYPSSEPNRAGILPAMVGSFLVILVTVTAAVPLGVAAGVYLEEYARKNWLTTLIEINIANLASVPSILYGLMALGVLVYFLGRNVLAGGLTLAFLILPIVIVATREALRSIPQSIREAAVALGATRWQVVWHHLLPYSASGISTGVIIGVSRALGETAPLVTIGAVVFINFLPWSDSNNPINWLRSSFTVMPIQMFSWVQDAEQEFRVNAAAAGIVLIFFTLSLNAVAIYLRYRLRRRIKW